METWEVVLTGRWERVAGQAEGTLEKLGDSGLESTWHLFMGIGMRGLSGKFGEKMFWMWQLWRTHKIKEVDGVGKRYGGCGRMFRRDKRRKLGLRKSFHRHSQND